MTERTTFINMVQPSAKYAMQDWAQRHSSAVLAWSANRATLTANEHMVLTALHGLWLICQLHGGDGFVREHVIIPMHIGLSDLLNVELDRLDGGTLSGFLVKLAEDLELEEVL